MYSTCFFQEVHDVWVSLKYCEIGTSVIQLSISYSLNFVGCYGDSLFYYFIRFIISLQSGDILGLSLFLHLLAENHLQSKTTLIKYLLHLGTVLVEEKQNKYLILSLSLQVIQIFWFPSIL